MGHYVFCVKFFKNQKNFEETHEKFYKKSNQVIEESSLDFEKTKKGKVMT